MANLNKVYKKNFSFKSIKCYKVILINYTHGILFCYKKCYVSDKPTYPLYQVMVTLLERLYQGLHCQILESHWLFPASLDWVFSALVTLGHGVLTAKI